MAFGKMDGRIQVGAAVFRCTIIEGGVIKPTVGHPGKYRVEPKIISGGPINGVFVKIVGEVDPGTFGEKGGWWLWGAAKAGKKTEE